MLRSALAFLLLSLALPASAQVASDSSAAHAPEVPAETVGEDASEEPRGEEARAETDSQKRGEEAPAENSMGGVGGGEEGAPAVPISSFATAPGFSSTVAGSVNLFTGDVVLPLPLVSIPGRAGLSASVSAVYSSNTKEQVETRNLEAPTGPMGLGWSLGYDRIVADHKGTGAVADDEYYALAGGGGQRLIEQDSPTSAYRLFRTEAQPNWEYRYVASSETWTVYSDDGTVLEFGGKNSNRQTVDWLVRWGSFLGPAYTSSGQSQYALAWNLSTVTNLFGDQVTYTYLADDGKLGSGTGSWSGLTYTRSTYLQRVAGPDGRAAELVYGLKCDGDASIASGEDCQGVASRMEYVDPHSESGDELNGAGAQINPDAYQERYETRYLERVDALAPAGDVLFSVDLAYDFAGAGDMVKRRLTSVTHRAANGETMPALTFGYTSGSAVNPHVLETVTTPTGSVSTYTYTSKTPGNGRLDLTVPRPSGYDGEPRVWHGRDYAVIGWHKEISGDNNDRVLLQIYQWSGRWTKEMEYQVENAESITEGLSTRQNYEVALADNHIALLTGTHKAYEVLGTPRGYLHIFYRDPASPTGWLRRDRASIATEHENAPRLQLTVGDRYVAATSQKLGRMHVWTWTGLQWSSSAFQGGSAYPYTSSTGRRLFVRGTRNYLIEHRARNGTDQLYLHYLNGRGEWTRTSNVAPSGFDAESDDEIEWVLGDSYAVVHGDIDIHNGIRGQHLFTWDHNYAVTHRDLGAFNIEQTVPVVDAAGPTLTLARNGTAKIYARTGLGWSSPYTRTFSASIGTSAQSVAYRSSSRVDRALFNPSSGGFSTQTGVSISGSELYTYAGFGYYTYKNFVASSYYSDAAFAVVRGADGSWTETDVSPGFEPRATFNSPSFMVIDGWPGSKSRVYYLENGAFGSFSTYWDTAGLGSLTGQRLQPVGPNSFSTHAGYSFASTSSITLRRVARGQSSGTPSTPVVTGLTTDDGFQVTAQTYVYNTATATYDASSRSAQFNEVESYAGGTNAAGKPRYGSTKTFFFNGLSWDELQAAGAPAEAHPETTNGYSNASYYLDRLSGTMYKTATLDDTGAIVAEELRSTYVFRPTMNQAKGFLPRVLRVATTRDGVYTTVVNQYNDDNGYLDQTTTTTHVPDPDGSGADEHTTRTRYKYFQQGYSNGPIGLASPVIEVDELISTGRSRTSVTTWKDWGSGRWAPHQTYVWTGPAPPDPPDPPGPEVFGPRSPSSDGRASLEEEEPCDFEIEPGCDDGSGPGGGGTPPSSSDYSVSYTYAPFFTWWSGATPSSEWLRTSRVIRRTDTGAPRETESVDGVRSSIVYDDDGYPTASFSNASVTEAALGADASWLDFEAISEANGSARNDYWSFYAGNSHSVIAHSGERSRRIQTNSFGPTRVFQPTDQSGAYVLSAWVKTDRGFGANNGRLVFNTQSTGGAEGYPNVAAGLQTLYFGDTNGEWVYLETVIDLAEVRSQAGGLSETLQLRAYLHNVDGVKRFYVDDIRLSPRMGSFAATVYDPDTRVVTASLGVNGSVSYTSYDAFGRAIETRDRRGRVMGESYSALSREKTGGAFSRTTPNETAQRAYPMANLVANGSFELGADDTGQVVRWGDSVRLTPTLGTGATGRFALRATATGTDAYIENRLYDEGSLASSTTYTVSFLARCEGGSTCSSEVFLSRLRGDGSAAVIAGTPVTVSGSAWQRYDATITTSTHSNWSNGTLAPALRLDVNESGRTISFDDIWVMEGASPGLPSQTMDYSDGASKPRQSQSLSEAGVIVSETLYDLQSRAVARTQSALIANTGFGYRAGFVSDTDGRFGENNPNGTSNGGSLGAMSGEVASAYPAAGGYPYMQTRFERSALGRPLETSAPGASHRIGSGNTVRTAYTSNTTAGFPGSLPANRFYVTTVTDPDGNTSKTLTDRAGRTVASESVPLTLLSGSTVRPVTWYDYDRRGQLYRTRLPRHAQDSRFEITSTFDFAGRPVSSLSPDTGDSRTIYDIAGRPRFSQHADAIQSGYVIYTKYDRVGRAIESGYLNGQTWDEAFLQGKADDLAWPATPSTWRIKSVYDAYGTTQASNQGRLLHTETNNDASGILAEATETFTYDERGRTTGVDLYVHKAYTGTESVGYAYNDRGDITTIIYGDTPSSSNQVTYTYDALGRVAAVGTPSNGSAYRTYSYRADGAMAGYELAGSSSAAASFSYNAQGRLTSLQAPGFSEALSYSSGRGLIASAAYTYTGIAGQLNHAYTYDYDAAGQLTQALHSTNSALSIGASNTTRYDEHGNITRLQRGSTTRTYTYTAGTNRVQYTGAVSYSYDRRGNATFLSNKGYFMYDPFLNLPTEFDNYQSLTEYTYHGRRRVMKETDDGDPLRLYVHGTSGAPLYEMGTFDTIRYVYGPDGLVSTMTMDGSGKKGYTVRHVVSDHLGSTRVVLDQTFSTVQAYSYGAFGETGGVLTGGTVYRYTGQELDSETGLLNYRARLYDPELGRFLSVDPQGQFASPYVYAGNNPVMVVDPDGELGVLAFMALYTAAQITGDLIRGDINSFGDLALSAASGAAQGALASIGGGGVSLLGGVVGAASSQAPSISVGGGFSIAPSFSYGSSGFSAGIRASNAIRVGGVSVGVSGGLGLNAGGPLAAGAENAGSMVSSSGGFGLGYSSGGFSISKGWSVYDSHTDDPKDAQVLGTLSIQGGIFSVTYQNDSAMIPTYGDGGDRYRTAAFLLGIDIYENVTLHAGVTLFTGDPGRTYNERKDLTESCQDGYSCYNGYTASDRRYRMGALYTGARIGDNQYHAGINADWVRHWAQNIVAHTWQPAVVRFFGGSMENIPRFKNIDDFGTKPYVRHSTHSPYSLY